MKKKLLRLSDSIIDKIAGDIGEYQGSKKEKVDAITIYYRGYGLKYDDLVARYDLPKA